MCTWDTLFDRAFRGERIVTTTPRNLPAPAERRLATQLIRELRADGHASVELEGLRVHLIKLRAMCWWTIEELGAKPGGPLASGESRNLTDACDAAAARMFEIAASRARP